MPFQLVIAEGKEAGREFVFDQASIVIGRTSECDVVLYDPGVSRQHARIFFEDDAYFVEDMGSSNGTKVNGAIIKRKQLADGDAVALGPVVFSFQAIADDEVAAQFAPAAASGTEGSTRIVSSDEVARRRARRAEALAPENSTADELKSLARSSTRTMQPAARRSGPDHAVVRRTPPDREGTRTGGSLSRRRPGSPLSAVEKARLRRESPGLLGRLRIFWLEASLTVRGLLWALMGLSAVGALGLAYSLVIVSPADKDKKGPEPAVLTRQPIEDSFGLGREVAWERPDMKVFTFEYVAPLQAVVILHFQARDISQDEVAVTVNGTDVGKVPADTLNAAERSHELVVPPALLKKGDKNTVIFDSTQNPPGADPWRIWNVWVEISQLPELPPDQLLREANTTFQRGVLNFERRDIGAGNRYEAWKDFRTTWLMLESHPEPKPELYHLARTKMKEAQLELDRKCSQLMLTVETLFNQHQFDAARGELDHVRHYFPANDQPCPWRAEQKRAELDP